MTTLVGVAQRGWSGQMYVTCHISGFLFFFFFFFCFLQLAPRSHVLTDRHDLYAKRSVSGQNVPFGGLDDIRLHLGVKPPKTSPKWAVIGISQPNQRSSKIRICRSLTKIFSSNYPDRLITGKVNKEMQN